MGPVVPRPPEHRRRRRGGRPRPRGARGVGGPGRPRGALLAHRPGRRRGTPRLDRLRAGARMDHRHGHRHDVPGPLTADRATTVPVRTSGGPAFLPPLPGVRYPGGGPARLPLQERLVKKKLAVVAVVLLALGGLATPAAGASGKKGVSANPYAGAATALKDVGAKWFYTWAADPQGIAAPAGTEFVPMIWGRDSVTQDQLDRAKAAGSTLLAFNEPDLAGQASMPVETALDLWPRLQSTGMRLGAPAVAYGGDVAGGWLDRFMSGAAARGYRVDFIPLHWYGGDFRTPQAVEQLTSYLAAVYARYHKPIWLTEYALIDFSQGTRFPSAQQQADFVTASTKALDG